MLTINMNTRVRNHRQREGGRGRFHRLSACRGASSRIVSSLVSSSSALGKSEKSAALCGLSCSSAALGLVAVAAYAWEEEEEEEVVVEEESAS